MRKNAGTIGAGQRENSRCDFGLPNKFVEFFPQRNTNRTAGAGK
jgi:hypothetical protein